MQKTVSEHTTHQTLKQMSYSSRSAHLVPLLSAKNSKLTIQFTQAHQNWTIEGWKNVPGLMRLNFCYDIQMVRSEFGPLSTCHKAQISSNWFLEHHNEFSVLQWPPQSPDLNPTEHLRDVVEQEIRIMDVQPTNLQQLCDAIMSIMDQNLWGTFTAPC